MSHLKLVPRTYTLTIQKREPMQFAIWENILLGLIALGVIFWMGPGIKATLERSQAAPKDWLGVLIPIAGVVLFVIFLIMTV